MLTNVEMIAMSSLIDAEFFKVHVEVPGTRSKFMMTTVAASLFLFPFLTIFRLFEC